MFKTTTAVLAFLLWSSTADAFFLKRLQCYRAFRSLQYDPYKYDDFNTFYRNTSVVAQVQIGEFEGIEPIKVSELVSVGDHRTIQPKAPFLACWRCHFFWG